MFHRTEYMNLSTVDHINSTSRLGGPVIEKCIGTFLSRRSNFLQLTHGLITGTDKLFKFTGIFVFRAKAVHRMSSKTGSRTSAKMSFKMSARKAVEWVRNRVNAGGSWLGV